MRIATALIVVLLSACGVRDLAAARPSASASSTATALSTASPGTQTPAATTAPAASTAAPTATVAPTPTATSKPRPTGRGTTYTSLFLTYRLDLPAGWRRSECQSTPEPVQDAIDTFTDVAPDDETASDTGSPDTVLTVYGEANTAGQTAMQWVESGKLGFSVGSHFEKATIDGHDGARVVPNDGSPSLAFAVSARGRIYAVQTAMRDGSTLSELTSMLGSFHVLTDAELAAARATIATPSPAPARTAQEVADTVSKGFAQRDMSLLASVMRPCITRGGENAGASFMSTSRFLRELPGQFAGGLTVTVRPSPLLDQTETYAAIGGTWNDAGQPARNVKFMITKIGTSWYWNGVLYLLN